MACDSPLWIKVKGQDMPVPCGKCPPCKTRRVNEWVFRLMWEEEYNSTSSHFVTLTYDTAHVPLTPNGFMSLRKRDLQLFFKRLRKLCPGSSVKYYACGEYGTQNNRPHYHAIIFNVPDQELYARAWSLGETQFGTVDVGTCTTDSVAYCLKYIDKDSYRARTYRHSRDDREREFPLMSKGLGAGYAEQSGVKRWHTSDLSRNYLVKKSGHRVAMPRYYRTKLFTPDQLEQQRDIINSAVQNSDEYDRLHHSHPLYTYSEKLEYEREGRRVKLAASQKKRNKI